MKCRFKTNNDRADLHQDRIGNILKKVHCAPRKLIRISSRSLFQRTAKEDLLNASSLLKCAGSFYSFQSLVQLVLIGHYIYYVHCMADSIYTELINISFCWSATTLLSMLRSLKEKVAGEFTLTSYAIHKHVLLGLLRGFTRWVRKGLTATVFF